MRIMPIIYNHSVLINKSDMPNQRTIPQIRELQYDTITFSRKSRHAEQLKELMKYGMLDAWTGKFVISPDFFQRVLKYKVFSFPIKNVIVALGPAEKTLHKVPAEIFAMLKEYSKTNPGANMEKIFKQWAPYAQMELKKIQMPIFNKLEQYALALPAKERAQFDLLMKTTKKQIHSKAILQEFDKKDYLYKLERISQEIKQKNNPDEISTIKKIIKLAQEIPETKPAGLAKRIKAAEQKAQKNSFYKLNNYFERSILADNKELETLFYNIKCQLLDIPSFIPFSRKIFIDEIKLLVKNLKDTNLKNNMIATAISLPTSTEEVSAFIVKASRQSSEKIGYELFHGSVGNVDHIIVKSGGGEDSLDNYLVSTCYVNSKRGNTSIEDYMRQNPKTYRTLKKYFERLSFLYKKGIIKKVGLDIDYITNLITKMEKLSPKTKPLKINCDI